MSRSSATVAEYASRDSEGRSPHKYMVDAFTHSFYTALREGSQGLQDAVLVREKEYPWTPTNTHIEELKKQDERPRELYGRPKGDWDFAVVYLDSRDIHHWELCSSERASKAKENSCEDEVERVSNSIDTVNDLLENGWSHEHKIKFASDSEYLLEEDPPRYVGEQYATDQAFEKARKTEAFEQLDENLFGGEFWHGRKIGRKQED